MTTTQITSNAHLVPTHDELRSTVLAAAAAARNISIRRLLPREHLTMTQMVHAGDVEIVETAAGSVLRLAR